MNTLELIDPGFPLVLDSFLFLNSIWKGVGIFIAKSHFAPEEETLSISLVCSDHGQGQWLDERGLVKGKRASNPNQVRPRGFAGVLQM